MRDKERKREDKDRTVEKERWAARVCLGERVR